MATHRLTVVVVDEATNMMIYRRQSTVSLENGMVEFKFSANFGWIDKMGNEHVVDNPEMTVPSSELCTMTTKTHVCRSVSDRVEKARMEIERILLETDTFLPIGWERSIIPNTYASDWKTETSQSKVKVIVRASKLYKVVKSI